MKDEAEEQRAGTGPGRALVDAETLLDARLALYHRRERWLAVADLHFGYELSQRAAGALFPLWGMEPSRRGWARLLADYRPERLIIVGDFVHDRAARETGAGVAAGGCARKRRSVLLAGNHDRRAFDARRRARWFVTEGFCFHHGDGPAPRGSRRAGGR